MADGYFLDVESGVVTQKGAINSSAGAGDAGKIPKLDAAGKISATMMPAGVAAETRTITCSENLSAGDLVNIHDDTGPKVRKADAATAGKEAHGFVLSAYTSGQSATVYPEENVISGLTGLTPGARQFLSASTAGALTATPPSASANVVQEVGVALSTTEVMFRPQQPITLA